MNVLYQCKNCFTTDTYDVTEFVIEHEMSVLCHKCLLPINISTETTTPKEKLQHEAVFENGDIVRFDHIEHVWHNEIAIICGAKHKFYRLELHGKKIWVPENWVRHDESLNTND